MWLFFSSFCVGLFPLWQGRKTALHTIKSVIQDLSGKKRDPVVEGVPQEPLRGGGSSSEEVSHKSAQVVEKS